jgi:hypothetical protein
MKDVKITNDCKEKYQSVELNIELHDSESNQAYGISIDAYGYDEEEAKRTSLVCMGKIIERLLIIEKEIKKTLK